MSKDEPGTARPAGPLRTPFELTNLAVPDRYTPSTCESPLESLPDLTAELAIGSSPPRLQRINMPRPHLGHGYHQTFSASRRMQEMLGLQGLSQPFMRPPTMPVGLQRAFEEGLKEYGASDKHHEDPHAGSQGEKGEELEVVHGSEEMIHDVGSPGKKMMETPESSTAGSKRIHWAPSIKALTDEAGARKENSQNMDFVTSALQEKGDVSQKVDTTGTGCPSLEASPFPQTNSLEDSRDYWPPPTGSITRRPQQMFGGSLHDDNTSGDRPSAHQAPFPLGSLGRTASLEASLSLHPNPSAFFSTLFCGPAPLPPNVAGSPIAPLDVSRKRRGQTSEEVGEEHVPSRLTLSSNKPLPAKKKPRGEPIPTGLPALASDQTTAWKSPFLGNTEGLSHTLITWHDTLRALYSRVQDPYLMTVHPMFPYPPKKPVHVPLVSASFWDLGEEPPKEVWFIGPGDLEIMSYNEVDTFRELAGLESSTSKLTSAFKLTNIKAKEPKAKEMRDRALTGDGRWCFLVLRGHPPKIEDVGKGKGHQAMPTIIEENERQQSMEAEGNNEEDQIAHFIVLAFPKSAVTKMTECFHCVYPDAPEDAAPAQDTPEASPEGGSRVGESSSTPVLNRALRTPGSTIFGHDAFAETQPQDQPTLQQYNHQRGEPWTLRRTTLWFEKAEFLPLIEGYRTNLWAWWPFLEAVGRGRGKLTMFCETESHIKT